LECAGFESYLALTYALLTIAYIDSKSRTPPTKCLYNRSLRKCQGRILVNVE